MHERYARAADLLSDAVRERIFPGAVAEVGSSRGMEWRACVGRLTFDEHAESTTPSTIYDLASLTKPLATTSLALWLESQQRLRLDDAVARYSKAWVGSDHAGVTIQHLLEHASGLGARLNTPPPSSVEAFERAIGSMPLEHAPGTTAVYSDLGFILLGFCLERAGSQPLPDLATALLAEVLEESAHGMDSHLFTAVPADALVRTAPTMPLAEDTDRRHPLKGEVHDNYAAALGGFAGHAGLFGTASGVGAIAQVILDVLQGTAHRAPFTRALVSRMITPSRVPGSSRALGWDTMRPTSSCGRYMSSAAIGHVGFTGTSVWIDPEIDRYFVLLTNRVCNGGSSDDMQRVRRAFHERLTGA